MILKNFVVLEGIDGSGTSTQCKILQTKLPFDTYFTAEPTTGPVGKFLRKVLKGDTKLDSRTICYLFAADRAEHLYSKEGVLEQAKSHIVVSDRYLYSSLAYQSIDCGLELPKALNASFVLPEFLFFFDIEAQVALQRIKDRDHIDIYENLAFLNQTVQAYNKVLDLYKDSGTKIVKIDATLPVSSITEIIISNIQA